MVSPQEGGLPRRLSAALFHRGTIRGSTGYQFSGSHPKVYRRRAEGYSLELIDTMLIASRPFRSVGGRYTSAGCLLCQWRSFSTSYRRLAEKEPSATPSPPPPPPPSPLEGAPRSYGKSVTEFTPKPLNRPIGLPHRPRPGENWGIDKRTLQQRRDDFVDYDKHLIRRKEL